MAHIILHFIQQITYGPVHLLHFPRFLVRNMLHEIIVRLPKHPLYIIHKPIQPGVHHVQRLDLHKNYSIVIAAIVHIVPRELAPDRNQLELHFAALTTAVIKL